MLHNSSVTGVSLGNEPIDELIEPWQRIFEEYLPLYAGSVPWVDSFLRYVNLFLIIVSRKARTIMIGCYERTKKYQRDFEIASHNLYTKEINQGNLLDGKLNLQQSMNKNEKTEL
jgi:hypothetical protein